MQAQSMKALILLFCFCLISCGRESNVYNNYSNSPTSTSTNIESDNQKVINGIFFDSAVEGLTYKGKLSQISGVTTKRGEFKCEKGEKVDFSIGLLHVGSTDCSSLVTPYNFALEDYQSENLATLFMALDEDGNVDNGIKIPKSIQNQTYETSSLSYVLQNYNEIRTVAQRMIDDAPANSFYNGGKIPTLEKVRLHLEASLIDLGSYAGQIDSIIVDNGSSNCFGTRLMTAKVNAEDVTLSGFGEFKNSELSISFQRKLNSSQGSSDFNGVIDFPQDSEAAKKYDQMRITESLVHEGIKAKYEAGRIEKDGSFVVSCSGLISLTKDVEIPDLVKLRRIARKAIVNSAAILSLATAYDANSSIHAAAEIYHNIYTTDFYNCVMGQETIEKFKANCWIQKDKFVYSHDTLKSLIIRSQAINPLIPYDLVTSSKEMDLDIKLLEEILPYSETWEYYNPF